MKLVIKFHIYCEYAALGGFSYKRKCWNQWQSLNAMIRRLRKEFEFYD